MRFKKIGAALLACAMCFGVFSTTAFAYVDESVATEEPAVEEKVPETEPEEPMLPLTPDGNLTLVDDAGSPTKSGKQFITAVTKNGNYFYIIIDRDDKGEETVHFLNQVDEADLLKLKLNGGDMKSVQGDSGHAQVKMVADVYSHIIDDDRRLNAERMEAAFYSGRQATPEPVQPAATESSADDKELLLKLLQNPEMAALLKSLAKTL